MKSNPTTGDNLPAQDDSTFCDFYKGLTNKESDTVWNSGKDK